MNSSHPVNLENKVIQKKNLPFLTYNAHGVLFSNMQAHCANLITVTKSGLEFNQKIVKISHI